MRVLAALLFPVIVAAQIPTDTWSVGLTTQDDARLYRGVQLSPVGLTLGWRAMSHGDSPHWFSFPFAVSVFPALDGDRTYAVGGIIGNPTTSMGPYDDPIFLVTASMGLMRVVESRERDQLEIGGTIVTAIISPRAGPPASFGPTMSYTLRSPRGPSLQVGATLLAYGLGRTHVLVPLSLTW